jgi:hypothetical protein
MRAHARNIKGSTQLTKAPKPEDMPILHCPRCGRETVLRRRLYLGKEYIRTAPKPSGVVYAVRGDGTCDKCGRIERETSGKAPVARARSYNKYKHELTDEEIDQARDNLTAYWIQRRLRGVHPEGIHFHGDPR